MEKNYLMDRQYKVAFTARLLSKAVDLSIGLMLASFLFPFGVVLALVYLSLSDSMNYGQSFGKRLFGLKVIDLESGEACTVRQSFVRNMPLTLPVVFMLIPFWGWLLAGLVLTPLIALEIYLLIKMKSGLRLGDVMADTTVVNFTSQVGFASLKKMSWFDNQLA